MRILVSGSSGLIGTAVSSAFSRDGHTVLHLVRPQSLDTRPADGAVRWDPLGDDFEASKAEGTDAVVHLAGWAIAVRWNEERKRLMRSSRVDATRHLVAALGKLSRPPKVFIAASAIGYYGNRGDETLTEESAPGSDFLGRLCQDWEAESARAESFGARVVRLRIGIVLAAHGGALKQMLPPFRMGVGGVMGPGRQWMSWVALPELVGIIRRAIEDTSLSGAVNATSPNPATNAQFTRILGKVLRRPTVFPLPGFVARIVFGEMADALLLASQRVIPERLQRMGYGFSHPDLEQAFRAVLGRH